MIVSYTTILHAVARVNKAYSGHAVIVAGLNAGLLRETMTFAAYQTDVDNIDDLVDACIVLALAAPGPFP